MPLDTFNKFMVGAGHGGIVILNLPLQARGQRNSMPGWPAAGPLTEDEALSLAAWLVACTGKRDRFNEVLDAVLST